VDVRARDLLEAGRLAALVVGHAVGDGRRRRVARVSGRRRVADCLVDVAHERRAAVALELAGDRVVPVRRRHEELRDRRSVAAGHRRDERAEREIRRCRLRRLRRAACDRR
jgi:hypothetical protein